MVAVMLDVLAHPIYGRLFAAQALSLLGSGLTTVALGLLAFELAGGEAGIVLGTALAIKMVAYVGVAPFAAAVAERVPRRAMLVGLDVTRAGLVALLPFVSEVWHIYVLVFLFQAGSAAFTPTFQATIPDVLPDERDYTRALSLSRLAYDMEALVSPLVAGAVLALVSFHWLFVGNAIGFLLSAALVLSVVLPAPRIEEVRPFPQRLTRGSWIYLLTPRLRGLLALSFALSATGAMVIVNTVVIVKGAADAGAWGLGLGDRAVALFFAAYGLGSMVVALALPRALDRIEPRPVMLAGGALMALVALALGFGGIALVPGLLAWALLGAGASLVQTPAGLLLRRSSHPEDRPALFAAQFALSHACWLVAYPAAGWLGARVGMGAAFWVAAASAAAGTILAARLWPARDPLVIEHSHADLVHRHGARDDPHHAAAIPLGAGGHRHPPERHAHAFVIDDHHTRWPRAG